MWLSDWQAGRDKDGITVLGTSMGGAVLPSPPLHETKEQRSYMPRDIEQPASTRATGTGQSEASAAIKQPMKSDVNIASPVGAVSNVQMNIIDQPAPKSVGALQREATEPLEDVSPLASSSGSIEGEARNPDTQREEDTHALIGAPIPSLTVAEAEKIINTTAARVESALLVRYQKDLSNKLRVAQAVKDKEGGLLREYAESGEPSKGFFESRAKYEERLQDWLDERDRAMGSRDEAAKAIVDLQDRYTIGVAVGEMGQQAWDAAAKENPEVYAMLLREPGAMRRIAERLNGDYAANYDTEKMKDWYVIRAGDMATDLLRREGRRLGLEVKSIYEQDKGLKFSYLELADKSGQTIICDRSQKNKFLVDSYEHFVERKVQEKADAAERSKVRNQGRSMGR